MFSVVAAIGSSSGIVIGVSIPPRVDSPSSTPCSEPASRVSKVRTWLGLLPKYQKPRISSRTEWARIDQAQPWTSQGER